MTHTTTHERAHGCDPVSFQNDTTNDFDFATGQREGKAFATLAARFALAGHSLTRSNPADGALVYFAGRWGYAKTLHSLEAAEQFLRQLGGLNV